MSETDWLDMEPIEATVVQPSQPLARKPTRKQLKKRKAKAERAALRTEAEMAREALVSIENELAQKSMGIVDGVLSFPDLDPEDPMKVPQAWVDEHGPDKAAKKHRAATAGMLNSKDVPHAVKVAENMASTIIRARATEKSAARPLNVQVAVIPIAEVRTYEEVIVHGEGAEEADDEW